jgi:hypothetical protein
MRQKPELLRECERVNKVLRKEAKKLDLGTKISLPRLEEARQVDLKSFSYWAQLEFKEYVRRELEHHPAINASILINNGARLLQISTATTKRYLAALRAGRTAPFSSLGDIVMLNPNYVSPDLDSYWQDCAPDQGPGDE